jgi:hypothetical protein
VFLAVTPAPGAEPPAKGEDWRGVTRVRGRASIEYRYAQNDRDQVSHKSVEGVTQVEVDFTLERERPEAPEAPPLPAGASPQAVEMMRSLVAGLPSDEATADYISWRTDSAKITGTTFEITDYSYPWHNGRFTTQGEFGGLSLFELQLGLTIETGVWELTTPNRLKENYRLVTSGSEENTAQKTTRVIAEVSEIDGVESAVFDGALSGKPGTVQGRSTVEWGPRVDNPTFKAVQLGRLQFWPEYGDAPEVEVTIEGYAKWRPEGSVGQPTQPGNHLIARATLVPKDSARVEDLPRIKIFRFELVDTSKEPGVCLNWPLGATDTDYDLRLSAAPKFSGQLSKKDQANAVALTLNDDKGRPYAETQIDSYDFGGKAMIKVVCELQDGREITGVMKGEKEGEELVRLPKMNGHDWIAEAWRKEKKVEKLAAMDDDEKVEGQQHNGDGYTLYEEYRGWAVNGQHVEGDPERKDFFVLNLIGADGRSGIGLFGRLSKLRVHSKLRDETEMFKKARLMNGNHRDAPHRVDQHGVVLATGLGKDKGGDTAGIEGADGQRAFRPRLVAYVNVELASWATSVFSAKAGAQYNLSERDAQSAFDRAVAHELLHAVGVEHHGESLRELVWCNFQSANAPLNPTGRHRYVSKYSLSPKYYFRDGSHPLAEEWSSDRGPEIVLLWEDTRRDVFEDQLADYEKKVKLYSGSPDPESDQKYLAEVASKLAHTGKSADYWDRYSLEQSAGYDLTRGIWVGAKNGTDSGNELCVMRYYFANAYEIAGRKNAYYLIRPGSNRAGREICRASAGTGTNAASHEPQSRYGDAASGRGNCFGDICPNDAIPPRSTALK